MEKEKLPEGIDEVKEIEIEKKPEKKPLKKCLICGKETTGEVCSPEHQTEWVRRNNEKMEKEKIKEKETIEKNDPYKNPEALTEKEPTKQETKELIEEANNDPESKRHGLVIMKKSTKVMLWTFMGIFLILFATNMVWSNVNMNNFVKSQNETKIEVNTPVTVNAPDIPITNNYETKNNNTVNVNIDLSEDIAKSIADDVIDMINNTNFTA